MQILDTAFSAGVQKCWSKTFSILSISGFALRSTPLFHHHIIIHPVLFIPCSISVKRVSSSFIPVAFMIIYLSIHWPIYVWAMYSVSQVIYSCSSRWEWRSVLCYLFYARLIRVSCVVLTFILSSVTRVNLIWLYIVWIIGCLSRVLLLYCFDIIWYVLSCSSENIYKSKSQRKSKRIPAHGLLEFYWVFREKFDAGNRCRQCINNVIKLCYYLSGSFLCFQVLTAFGLPMNRFDE